MITIKIDGYMGKISALMSGGITTTGVQVYLLGPLADAVNAMIEQSVRERLQKSEPK